VAKGILKKTSSESTATASKKISLFGDKNDRHDLLIAEFKQAHRRMFAASSGGSDASGSESDSGRGNVDNDEKSDANKVADSAPPAPARDNVGGAGEKLETKNPGSLSVDSVESIAAAAGSGKPKAPPPPPPVKKSRLLSAQLSSSSSESLLSSGRSMSTFKPDR
jgi:hypothetical protein